MHRHYIHGYHHLQQVHHITTWEKKGNSRTVPSYRNHGSTRLIRSVAPNFNIFGKGSTDVDETWREASTLLRSIRQQIWSYWP